jgi:hypothetical protein
MDRRDLLCERIDLHQSERLVLPMLVDTVRLGKSTPRASLRTQLWVNRVFVDTVAGQELMYSFDRLISRVSLSITVFCKYVLTDISALDARCNQSSIRILTDILADSKATSVDTTSLVLELMYVILRIDCMKGASWLS